MNQASEWIEQEETGKNNWKKNNTRILPSEIKKK